MPPYQVLLFMKFDESPRSLPRRHFKNAASTLNVATWSYLPMQLRQVFSNHSTEVCRSWRIFDRVWKRVRDLRPESLGDIANRSSRRHIVAGELRRQIVAGPGHFYHLCRLDAAPELFDEFAVVAADYPVSPVAVGVRPCQSVARDNLADISTFGVMSLLVWFSRTKE